MATAEDKLYSELFLKYSPGQPRQPAGSGAGGEFASTGGVSSSGGTTDTALDVALTAYKPEIEKRYTDIVTSQFDRMVQSLGPGLEGISNNWTYARTFSGTVRPNVEKVNVDPLKPMKTGTWQINPQRLQANASKYADATIDSWKIKIKGKLGDLENPAVHRFSNQAFRITGVKAGKQVEISQSMILNVSKNGTLFNQFPAKIYVDGKLISEAKFKELKSLDDTLYVDISSAIKTSAPATVKRFIIAGGPNTGKTTTAKALAKEHGIKSVRNTDELLELGWSEASKAVADWMNEPGDWIIEGVVTPRAMRKWMLENPNKAFAKNTQVILLTEPFKPQSKGQEAMTKGMMTVFSGIQSELERRGVTSLKPIQKSLDLYSEILSSLKYSPTQARDSHGRFASGGGGPTSLQNSKGKFGLDKEDEYYKDKVRGLQALEKVAEGKDKIPFSKIRPDLEGSQKQVDTKRIDAFIRSYPWPVADRRQPVRGWFDKRKLNIEDGHHRVAAASLMKVHVSINTHLEDFD